MVILSILLIIVSILNIFAIIYISKLHLKIENFEVLISELQAENKKYKEIGMEKLEAQKEFERIRTESLQNLLNYNGLNA